MSQVVLKARNRDGAGSAVARRLRRAGRVPGVLYGRSGKAFSLDLDAREFSNSIKNVTESTIVKIELEDRSFDAFVKDTQRNIKDGNILHVDFYEVEKDVALRAKVQVHVHGNPVGVREGGILETSLREIEVECLPQYLPPRLDVDVSELRVNQSIHAHDLPLGEHVRLISGADQVVAIVKFARAGKAESTEAAGEATEVASSAQSK
ncbi:MAG: 50S ribosomal protein L25 [Treponema sp.]|jgi:large subunit ribosomal protein L25|nr:50S ribosomal protein L25 [Treponema sp.]